MLKRANVRQVVRSSRLLKSAVLYATLVTITLAMLGLLLSSPQPASVWSARISAQSAELSGGGRQAIGASGLLTFTAAYTSHLPLIQAPPPTLKSLTTQVTIDLPAPLQYGQDSFCTWDWCTLSPRLYHEPLADDRTLVGWTDASGTGHVSVITGTTLAALANFSGQAVRGLTVHADGSFAVLRWDATNKVIWLSKHQAAGAEVWKTNLNTTIAVPEFWLSDGRLTYGNGQYGAYFTVTGISGGFTGHYGDQLTYVNDSGAIQSGGWSWGCSHSMAQLISYHPQLSKFAPVCSSNCYASKGILANDSQVLYSGDGDCGGMVSTQLGQLALADQSWKLIFNALDHPPAAEGHGIGFATVNGNFQSNYIWLTNTSGQYERDPIMARLGINLNSGRYLTGWTTTNNGTFWLSIVDDAGAFIVAPEAVSAAGIRWGNRTDTLRTRIDGTVSWVQGESGSTQLHLFRLDGSFYLP